MKIRYNTGCAYTAGGQKIAAEYFDGEELNGIAFNDVSRGVSGWIACDRDDEPQDEAELKALTTTKYMRGDYTMTPPPCNGGDSGIDEWEQWAAVQEELARFAAEQPDMLS